MKSYSQSSEDLIVAKQFPAGFVGNMLEIGSWDPVSLSNSRMLIEMGWSAVLCEFSPGPVKSLVGAYDGSALVQVVCAAVTVSDDGCQKYRITSDAVSTNDSKVEAQWSDVGGYYGDLWVPTLPLDRLLGQFFGDRRLDYASVDIEGPSVDVAIALLKTEHRPNVLVVEHNDRTTELMAVAQELQYVAIYQNSENIILSGRWPDK